MQWWIVLRVLKMDIGTSPLQSSSAHDMVSSQHEGSIMVVMQATLGNAHRLQKLPPASLVNGDACRSVETDRCETRLGMNSTTSATTIRTALPIVSQSHHWQKSTQSNQSSHTEIASCVMCVCVTSIPARKLGFNSLTQMHRWSITGEDWASCQPRSPSTTSSQRAPNRNQAHRSQASDPSRLRHV